ncbi:SH3 domain-containing protein [Saccharopolyspora phatthalungensis]|uniref:SH3b domain-containing protein n=1 Tax=Saccharopolyspora phatthalungensis TaxID=664693 RepID=A0A840QD77_9PSEU|nr:SH3 domain-containing protein [Saccharopolyspora phatthalungensis]MBB5154893.1 hypothetical protein [Saccharopolyspora phatthalungensis]
MFPLPRPLLLLGAGAIGAIYLIGAGQPGSSPGETKPCIFRVTADILNVRSGPSFGAGRVDSLDHGAQVIGTPYVVGGFRDLGNARWAAAEFLAPAPGSICDP